MLAGLTLLSQPHCSLQRREQTRTCSTARQNSHLTASCSTRAAGLRLRGRAGPQREQPRRRRGRRRQAVIPSCVRDGRGREFDITDPERRFNARDPQGAQFDRQLPDRRSAAQGSEARIPQAQNGQRGQQSQDAPDSQDAQGSRSRENGQGGPTGTPGGPTIPRGQNRAQDVGVGMGSQKTRRIKGAQPRLLSSGLRSPIRPPEEDTEPERAGETRTSWDEDWGDWFTSQDRSANLTDWELEEDARRSDIFLADSDFRKNAAATRRMRQNGKPKRDEYMRQIIDTKGVLNRLAINADETERDIIEEFEENQWESREAIKFAGVLVGVPLLMGFVASALLADPFLSVAEHYNPNLWELSFHDKLEGAREVHHHELRLRMDAAIGRSPPLEDGELQMEMRREAHHLEHEFKEKRKHALLNLLSDSVAGTTFFVALAAATEARRALYSTFDRVWGGLSDTAKAFIIIASTDIFLGYHSEEGWTAAIRLLTQHYGQEVGETSIYVFVAIVPVTMDALFKYWIFKGLNRQSPAAAVTLRSMDRH